MSAALDKAKVSGIAGVFGAISAMVMGFANFFILAGFGIFFFTLLIQYGSIKFKAVTSLVVIVALLLGYLENIGFNFK